CARLEVCRPLASCEGLRRPRRACRRRIADGAVFETRLGVVRWSSAAREKGPSTGEVVAVRGPGESKACWSLTRRAAPGGGECVRALFYSAAARLAACRRVARRF